MTSERKIEANRRNALRSTGPKTLAGKQRSAQNASRHGLNLPAAACDPTWPDQIKALAQAIAGEKAPAPHLELARTIAEAQIDLVRIRRVRLELWSAAQTFDSDAIKRLAAMDYYERLAWSRRKHAIRRFDEALTAAVCGNEPTARKAPAVETNPSRK